MVEKMDQTFIARVASILLCGLLASSYAYSATPEEKGFEIDRKKINFNTKVKEVGDYAITIDLHKEVKKEVPFKVVAE